MARLSVVVPIYNVEEYLGPCLDSIAAQTFRDLEVIMVDDGSTDRSAAIAATYAERDDRFKLVSRPNGGLSAARNTGIGHAAGEFLAFVDSDDLLPDNAYELLVGTLDETGSDFSTGKVLRLVNGATRPARFLAATFRETRLKTHVRKFQPLLADRIAWNKVFRRSFWDANGLEFPEGRINEDIPVMLPLHFSARAVDVIAEPVYLWRMRETGALSITERRAEKHALLNRIQAVTDVHDWLAEHEDRKAKRWYDQTLVTDDLKYHLNVLDRADDEYRALFLDMVNALLDRADDEIYDRLPSIERLKWHLVRRRLLPELLEVLRFQREDMPELPPVLEGRDYYGQYPFRGDERLAIPDDIYKLGRELTLTTRIEAIERDGDRLRVTGLAFVDGIGAPSQGFQRVAVSALRPGPLRRVRLLTTALRFSTKEVHRPDANAEGSQRVCDISWAGFEATLDVGRLRRLGRWRDGRWDLYVTVRAPEVTRRRMRFFLGDVRRPRAVELPAPAGVLARAVPTEDREVALEVRSSWAAVTGAHVADDAVVISGELHGAPAGDLRLELRGEDLEARRRRPLTVDGERFEAAVPLRRLLDALREPVAPDAGDDEEEQEEEDLDGRAEAADDADEGRPDGDEEEAGPVWELYVIGGGGRRMRVALPDDVAERAWPCEGREVALFRTPQGDASLALRAPHGVLTQAAWADDGTLEVAGEIPASELPQEFVIASRATGAAHPLALGPAAHGGRFALRLTPAAVATLAGVLPLPEGRWLLGIRTAGELDPDAVRPLTLAHDLRDRLPLPAVAGGKPMQLTLNAEDRALLVVRLNLTDDERGPYNQRRLRETAYRAHRTEPLADTVVYSSFRARQYSDSPRAIHEELLRRDVPLEHIWLVRDAAAIVPDGATVLRDGSREAHEALARARYVVVNDHFPDWFSRRPDQTCVQTWHGTPLKRLGFDVSGIRAGARHFQQVWDEQEPNWQYVVSPNRFATPILRDTYRLTGELLETGYPRDDVFAGPDLEQRLRRLRERLGIPESVRTLLYAPTFRDHVRDGRGRYRLDLRLDIDRLREAAGPDTVLLFRKHHYIVDAVPQTPDGFVRDVSTYPDGTELLLAADVLITDYSSMSVDYANTGRPMLFFTPDLETYRDEVRGFYLDFEETMPGPLLRTGAELAEAVAGIDALRAEHAERYARFVERFCELDDGAASARVVDRVFSDVVAPAAADSP